MDQYQIHDLSERQLKFGYWLLTHAGQFKKTLIIALIAVSAVFWGLTVYGLVKYAVDLKQDQEIIRGIAGNVVDFEGFRQRNRPQDLVFSPARVIYTGANKYDFAAEVYNPNVQRGVATLNYYFTAGDFATAPASIALWPGQRAWLLSLANATAKRLAEPELKIISLSWQPLIERSGAFLIEPISVSQVEFVQAAGRQGRSYATFVARNNLLENFWQVDFQAVLYSNNNLVGVNQIMVTEFLAASEQQLEMSWFESLPRVTRAEIIPLVDIYQPANLYTLPGRAAEE